jgi:predicted metal-dependent phosphoesterase TrpH
MISKINEMEKLIDVHTHNSWSDGSYTPSDLVRYAEEKGLADIAITDHECMSGIDEAIKVGNKVGVEVIPGVELSTRYNDKSIHIVGLFIDQHDKGLIETTIAAEKEHYKRCEKIFHKLAQLGFKGMSYKELKTITKVQIPTLPYLCEYMLSKGFVKNISEAKEKYLGKGKAAYAESTYRLDVSEAVSLIHNAGGIAIWAHPVLCRFEPYELDETVAVLKKEIKIDGLEVYHSAHSQIDSQEMTGLAEKYELLISGGSDFHGRYRPEHDLGIVCGGERVPYAVLDKMRPICAEHQQINKYE